MMHVEQIDQAIVDDCDDPSSVPASSNPNGSAWTGNEIDYMGLLQKSQRCKNFENRKKIVSIMSRWSQIQSEICK